MYFNNCSTRYLSSEMEIGGPNRRGNRARYLVLSASLLPLLAEGSHAETMIKIVNMCGRPPVLRPLRAFGTLPPHPIY